MAFNDQKTGWYTSKQQKRGLGYSTLLCIDYNDDIGKFMKGNKVFIQLVGAKLFTTKSDLRDINRGLYGDWFDNNHQHDQPEVSSVGFIFSIGQFLGWR